MALDSISSGYGLSFWQLANSADNTGSGSTTAPSSSSVRSASSASAYSGGSDMIGTLSAAVSKAMSTLGLGKNDRVTFSTLNEARGRMEEDFSAEVKENLKKLGVDEDIEFRLVTNSQGGVDVISTHEDAKTVEKYFQDNPNMVAKFQEIMAMSNIEAARKAGGYDVKAMRERIQVESMVNWFSGTGQNVQQLMQYENMQAVYAAAGINKVA